ncbi:cytochrome c5, partial [Candidatus Thiomargarita nelsonii]
MSQEDTISIRNLAIGIAVGFGAIVTFIVMVLLITKLGIGEHHEESKDMLSERLKPVGQVNIKGTEMVAQAPSPVVEKAAAPKSAKEIYDTVCQACHTPGILEAPKYGDKAAWADRIAKGEATLIQNAINGFNTMPPRGGNATLSDEEVKLTVQYMLAAVDSSSPAAEQQETPVAATSTPPQSDTATEPAPVDAASAHTEGTGESTDFDLALGEEIYNTACFACHATGVLGAPKLGDKDGWTPRIAKDMDTLFTNALQGFQGEVGMMPPKGGRMDLSDDSVKAAVAYMVAQVATSPTAEEAAPVEAASAPTESAPESTDLDLGEEIYNTACVACHAMGVLGAPKLGDKDGWAPRITKGMDTLFTNALQGFQGEVGMMPPKGGRMDLPDDSVKAAVAYMVSQGQ